MKPDKNLMDVYDKIFEKSISEIEKISKDLGIHKDEWFSFYRSVLVDSSRMVKGKWETGRKYARTAFVRKALGSSYPEELTEKSLSVDSIINILDDLFDEKLDTLTKSLLIIETGVLLGFLNKHEMYTKKVAKIFGEYLYKIVFMGLTERILKEALTKTEGTESFFRIALSIYLARSMDIDFFVQIVDKKLMGEARTFRALNLIKKDMDDIEHDIENENDTPITILYKRDKELLKEFIEFSLVEYSKYLDSMKSSFREMSAREIKSIKGRVKKI